MLFTEASCNKDAHTHCVALDQSKLEKRMIKAQNLLKAISLENYIATAVFVLFLALNLWTTGPAYLSDEVGYLDKAATIAGSVVHVASSWYGGYSLLISPAFLLSSHTAVEWHIVLVLNALMWAGSARLLFYVLSKTYPDRTRRAILWAGAGALIYPSWLAMSGYAFSTSGFVFIFVAALAALIKSKLEHRGWLLAGVLLSGYLCWIHPFGFIFVGLVTILLGVRAFRLHQLKPALFGLTGVLFAAVYGIAVDPWLRKLMSGSISADSHYADVLPALHAALGVHFWAQFLEVLVGLLLFAIVSTFGLMGYGAFSVLRRAWSKPRQIYTDSMLAVKLLVTLSVIGVIVAAALLEATSPQLRIDQWIYGRYTDMYLLPLISFGLLATWKLKVGLLFSVFAAGAGIFLSVVTNATNTAFVFDNKVNLEAFWPMHLASVMHLNYYWLWGLLGSIGIAAVACVARRKQYLVLLVIPVALVAASNMIYHHTLLGPHAQVSTLDTFIQTNYSRADCIGFTNGPDPNERFSLYSYDLHGYTVERMPLGQWLTADCRGMYLTYTPAPLEEKGLKLAGEETSTGLYAFYSAGSTGAQPIQFK